MARKPQDNPQLDMTPMIDVVFELIIFFVVTIKSEDMFSRLNANRPAPSPPSANQPDSDPPVTIQIGKGRDANGVLAYNGREVKRKELDQFLHEVSRTSKKTPIIIRATEDSPHKALVDALDICYRNELFSVSIFTM